MNVLELVLIVGFALTQLYYVMVHIPSEQKKRYESKLGNRHETKRIIDVLRVKTCIGQVLIWESFNGNGMASFGNKLKISVVEQSYEQPFPDVYERFQELEIYGEAIDIMMQMQQNGSTARYIHDMNDGIFKRVFGGENAQWVEWFAIGPGSDKTFFFATIATGGDQTPYQINEGGEIEIAKNSLRNRYKKINHTFVKRWRKKLYI